MAFKQALQEKKNPHKWHVDLVDKFLIYKFKKLHVLLFLLFLFFLYITLFLIFLFVVFSILFALFFFLPFFLLCIPVGNLVVDEVVQGDYGSDEGSQVHHYHLVVGLQVKGLDELLQADVGQQVEHILQLVDYLMVDGKLACGYFLQIAPDVQELGI